MMATTNSVNAEPQTDESRSYDVMTDVTSDIEVPTTNQNKPSNPDDGTVVPEDVERPQNDAEVSKFVLLKSRLRLVTVEPILFLFMLSAQIIQPTVQAMVYRKTCLREYNMTVCDNLDLPEYLEAEETVQRYSSQWYMALNFCYEVPSIFVSFVYGNLSDKVNRKMALMLPIIGQLLSSTNFVMNAYFFDLPVYLLLLGPSISGLFGGWIGCTLASFSYISEVSTPKTRTIRIALGECAISLSIASAYFMGGALLDKFGFTIVFLMCLGLYVLTFIYGFFAVPNPVSDANPHTRAYGCRQKMQITFSPKSIKEAMQTVFKKRPQNKRTHLIMLYLVLFFSLLAFAPSTILVFLYVKRQPLSWSQTLVGYYLGYNWTLSGFGLIVLLPILKKIPGMREMNIPILAMVTNAIAQILFGFSTQTWMIFIVPAISMLSIAIPACTRSLISQIVEKKEFGKVFAVFGSLQSISTLVGSLTYNPLYSATLDFWPGTCFVIGAAVSVIPISMQIWLNWDTREAATYVLIDDSISSGRASPALPDDVAPPEQPNGLPGIPEEDSVQNDNILDAVSVDT